MCDMENNKHEQLDRILEKKVVRMERERKRENEPKSRPLDVSSSWVLKYIPKCGRNGELPIRSIVPKIKLNIQTMNRRHR